MQKNTKKNEQHIIPKTYIKHWRISNENFVYVKEFSNKYSDKVKKIGLNDSLFKKKKYYNDKSLSNPYFIEDTLGSTFEPLYDEIINELISEKKLSENVRKMLIQWLYISKMRSPHIRDSTQNVLNFIYKTQSDLQGISKEEHLELLKEISKNEAKKIHLNTIEKPEKLFDLFFETLIKKEWQILKSNSQLEFWTNDNPGFSLNTDLNKITKREFHKIMEMNEKSIIIYQLTPKYCLLITPINLPENNERNFFTMDIKYKDASVIEIEYINKGTFFTRNNLVISNNKESLEYYIRTK